MAVAISRLESVICEPFLNDNSNVKAVGFKIDNCVHGTREYSMVLIVVNVDNKQTVKPMDFLAVYKKGRDFKCHFWNANIFGDILGAPEVLIVAENENDLTEAIKVYKAMLEKRTGNELCFFCEGKTSWKEKVADVLEEEAKLIRQGLDKHGRPLKD